MKITIIGAGNMGGSAAVGFASRGVLPGADITVTARHAASLERFRQFGIRTSTDNVSAVRDASLVICAVKPWQMEGVVKEIAPALDYDRQLLVSFAPGVTPAQLREWLDRGGKVPSIAYVIPNTAIEIGESMTYISPVTASEADTARLKELFDRVGKSLVVPADQMLNGTSLASCGIAYAMRYISASAEGGLQLGLDAEEVGGAVCQTVRNPPKCRVAKPLTMAWGEKARGLSS